MLTMPAESRTEWPALPPGPWRDTYATLHMWTQVVGKVCLALTPLTNHYWNIAFRITSTGVTTPLLNAGDRMLTIAFDFVDHQLLIVSSDGRAERVALVPQTVARFHQAVMDALGRMGVDVRIWTMPVEVPDPIRFDKDTVHHAYDPAAANTLWRILLAVTPVLEEFRAGYIGKCSPVHFFWGSFDLAVTRFSGRPAPERPGADPITRESYSHEVISHGFWPGSAVMAEPAFYAYAAPEPDGFSRAPVRPAAAFYSRDLSEFILPYEAVRTSATPVEDLTAFLHSTYDAGADLGRWPRHELERRQAV
jgi:hypothetical protein